MKYETFFPDNVKSALSNDPPGAWMPKIPHHCIRLHAGYPAPSLIPDKEINSAVNDLITTERDLPFHYLGSSNVERLKEKIRRRLSERGITARENELLLTSGSSQAIDLIARILLDQSAIVVVEAPTYMEALETFKNYTRHILTVPIDEHGLKVDALETVLRKRKKEKLPMPRFVYTIPSFHNPTGVTMSHERRRQLLSLASQFDFLIVEDDAYGELSFSKSPVPLKAIDTEGRVLYVGSLSKVVAPGIRVGWIAGAENFVSSCKWFKKDLDHPFMQAAIGTYLHNSNFKERIKHVKEAYRKRRDCMVAALRQSMPEWVTWDVPDGGYFVWLHAPNIDASSLLEESLNIGVSFIPGQYFFLHPHEGKEYLRLSFSYEQPERMTLGVQKLAELIRTNVNQ
ncbi:PLP-dependent aminotransferase family protein [Fictibacillus sp. Mic-4]|uniref:aminotransferase-like domain-containing protein n=1 Tax=Fictibacillus sp. Mic-4 TaxID=3132826 RepID=UPI003CE829B6